MRKVRCRNGFKESCCHGKSLVTDSTQAVEKLQKKSYTAQEMRNCADNCDCRNCINWSNNDHCAKTKCNYCTKDCRDYRKLGGISETENALAELAKGIRVLSLWVDSKYENILGKAQRIVAELAKVSDGHWEVICDGPDAYFCTAGDLKVQCAIGRCRAIAEEGANNGKM